MTPDSLPWVRLTYGDLSLNGGHVTRWRRAEGPDVLFMSERSRFEPGQAIRGGVPVIFPWFGDDPERRGRSAHGFARRWLWRLEEQVEAAGRSRCVVIIDDDKRTLALWPHRFRARLAVEFGESLSLTFTVENTGDAPFAFEAALHTYFTVGDVTRIGVRGLEQTNYLDKVDGFRPKTEGTAPVTLAGEVDRVYLDTTATCHIDDPALDRTITVEKTNSRSTILWNPGREKSATMSDLAPDDWSSFVCVESGNVGDAAVTLAPGATHELAVRVVVT